MLENKNFKSGRKKKSSEYGQLLEGSKLPPQAIDLEEAVLGALMLEKNAISVVIEILRTESFYKEANSIIYQAIIDLNTKAQPIDILTVTAELRKGQLLEQVGGAYYITMLTNRVASAANIETHARIVAQKFLQRELIRISGEIQQEAFDENTDAFELLDNAELKLFTISQGNIKKDYRAINDLMREALKQVEELKNKKGGLTGIPSGFTKLDRITSGFQRSDLIIIAARPGMGKTAFALSIARNASIEGTELPRAIGIFSLEMNNTQLVTRMLSAEAEIDSEKMKQGTIADHEWAQLQAKIAKLNDAPIFIDDTPSISVFELRAKCRRLKQQHNVDMIIIDYLQLMRGDDSNNKNGNREQEVSYISRSLKALAKELNVPVIALAQLSRQSERRGNTARPMLSDLRESGSIEQDADIVMFIYRPEYYGLSEWEDGSPTTQGAEIVIAKHRNGATGSVRLRFISRLTKFADAPDFDYAPDNSILTDNSGTITLSSRLNDFDEDDHRSEPPPF